MPISRDLFLQQTSTAGPAPLEMFVKVREPGEFHFYAKHVSILDFFLSFGGDIRGLECLIYRMPPALLNPNYWEPLTRETEALVREKMTGVIIRQEGEKTLLWRADAVAPGRYLRDGLDLPLELLHGYVFRTGGEAVLQIGRAWAGGQDRFEWIGFASLPPGPEAAEIAVGAHADLTAFRLRAPEARMAFTSLDDRVIRVVFPDRAKLRRAVAATVRGFATGITRQPSAAINDRVADQMIRLCDGVGFSSDPKRDFLDKRRTFEITARLAATEWGVHLRPGQETLLGDEKVLLYYDRISGLWAVAS